MTREAETDVQGKAVVITGASSGIGSATARALDALGAKLLLVARSGDKLEAVASELTNATVLPLDVTDPDAAPTIIDRASFDLGGIDVLVNNAGMMAIGPVDELDIERAMSMVRLNVEATFRLALHCARHMKARGSGDIVNLSSVAGLKTSAGLCVYNGTKFAVEGFTDALRMELAPHGVRVSCVQPGTVATNLFSDWDSKDKEHMESGGTLQPDDIASTIVWMLSQPAHMTLARAFAMPSRLGV